MQGLDKSAKIKVGIAVGLLVIAAIVMAVQMLGGEQAEPVDSETVQRAAELEQAVNAPPPPDVTNEPPVEPTMKPSRRAQPTDEAPE